VTQQRATMQATGLQHTAHTFACPTEGHTHPLSVARNSDIYAPWAAPARGQDACVKSSDDSDRVHMTASRSIVQIGAVV